MTELDPSAADASQRTRDLGRQLEARMRSLLERVRRRFLLHGLGWMVAAAATLVVVYFALDRFLDLPIAVRLILSLALAIYLAIGFRRRLAYPLSKKILDEDVAIAVERRFPSLQQRLISALQLASDEDGASASAVPDGSLRGQSAAMVAKVVDEAAAEVARLPTEQILDPKRTKRVWTIAGIAVLVTGFALLRDTRVAGVFVTRMFGATTSYPRDTQLFVELPTEDPGFEISIDGNTASVVLAAGGDLPVLVRAEGEVPRDVELMLDSGPGVGGGVGMTSRGGGRFRHVFRRVHKPFSFFARGGDDPRGDLLVSVDTVAPPRVATIRAEIRFPDYTGRPPAELVGGGIEAVIGSTARVVVRATEAVRSAQLRFVDAGTVLELTPIEIQDDSGDGIAYEGIFVLDRSDRYQIDFVGVTGIGNPRPGTYPIVAQEDYAPVGKLVAPAPDDILVILPDAILPLRIFASDDFGVRSVEAQTVVGEAAHERAFDLIDASNDSGATGDLVASRLLEVRDLGPDDSPVAVGDTILVRGTVVDNRAPEPQVTEIPDRHVHVVGPSDLTRRISGHFRRIRESVEKALDLQSSRRERLTVLRSELVSNGGLRSAITSGGDLMIAVEVGQGRVLAESRRMHRELMRSFDLHLFNRLDDSLHAPKVVELYVDHYRSYSGSDSVDPAFYRSVSAARASGAIGAMEKTLDPILGMLELADRLATELGPSAVRAIESASVASSDTDFAAALESVESLQATIIGVLEELRGDLDEWNEFQDVIQQARAIRDRQKDLRNRTRNLQGSTK